MSKRERVPIPLYSTRRQLMIAVRALLLLCICSLPVQAQVLYGSLTGNVTDASNAAVAGARVEALDVSRGIPQETTTDSSGIYRFTTLQPGVYRITISAPNFASLVMENIARMDNSVRWLDTRLQVAKVQE